MVFLLRGDVRKLRFLTGSSLQSVIHLKWAER